MGRRGKKSFAEACPDKAPSGIRLKMAIRNLPISRLGVIIGLGGNVQSDMNGMR